MERDKILEILKEYRNTEIGNLALANIISGHKGLNNLTTDPLCTLLVNSDGEKSYIEIGNICEITPNYFKIGKKIYHEN